MSRSSSFPVRSFPNCGELAATGGGIIYDMLDELDKVSCGMMKPTSGSSGETFKNINECELFRINA